MAADDNVPNPGPSCLLEFTCNCRRGFPGGCQLPAPIPSISAPLLEGFSGIYRRWHGLMLSGATFSLWGTAVTDRKSATRVLQDSSEVSPHGTESQLPTVATTPWACFGFSSGLSHSLHSLTPASWDQVPHKAPHPGAWPHVLCVKPVVSTLVLVFYLLCKCLGQRQHFSISWPCLLNKNLLI